MNNKETATIRRKIRVSYATSVISMSLVLFILGMISYMLINARHISVYVQENIGITVMLKGNIKDSEVESLTQKIKKLPYVRLTNYISKEQAAKELHDELGKEFVDLDFLGYNPLSPAIDIKVKSEYAYPDSLKEIASAFQGWNEVEEAVYQKALIEVINENINKVSFVFILFCGLLLLIAISVVNNSVRLTVHAKRFTIKTMQLVGSTHGFIRWPFLKNSIWLGILGAIFANVWLALLIYVINRQLGSFISLRDYETMSFLFGFVLIMGISLNWISTFYSVNKYLNTDSDLLYY